MFTFKQFTIKQERCAMKVGTDGVLLGAWTPVYKLATIDNSNASYILDIGTGTGLIALMLAQRTNTQENTYIHAIEIDQNAAIQTQENAANTIFKDKVNVIHTSLQNYLPEHKYTHIVCNPPFFVNSLKCPDKERNTARHTDTLSFDILIENAHRLLYNNGTFNVIIPHDNADTFIKNATKMGFSLKHFTHVYPTPQSVTAKRALLNFIKTTEEIETINTKIIIELSRHIYTPEYIALTKDFYLKM